MLMVPKMKKTITVIYDRRKRASRDKKGAVEICVSYGGERKRIATGVLVFPGEWRNGKVIRRDDAQELNERIEDVYESVASLTEKSDFTLDMLDYANGKKSAVDERMQFLEWLEIAIEDNTAVRDGTRAHHKCMLRSLLDSGLFPSWEDVTRQNIAKWDDMLRGRKIQQNTIYGYHKRLRPYLRKAVILGYLKRSPYEAFKPERGKDGGRTFLTEKERNAVERLKLTGTAEIARDLFVFACYTGLSYSDIVKIKRNDVFTERGKQKIWDKRVKTDTPYKITLLPKAVAILKKYKYDLDRLSDVKCNEWLKIIAADAKIDKRLTMHVGRHTFATWALSKGVSIEVVSKMLGHTNITTTQLYAKVLQKSVDEGFGLLG
jgi:integrase/recombinase XerD